MFCLTEITAILLHTIWMRLALLKMKWKSMRQVWIQKPGTHSCTMLPSTNGSRWQKLLNQTLHFAFHVGMHLYPYFTAVLCISTFPLEVSTQNESFAENLLWLLLLPIFACRWKKLHTVRNSLFCNWFCVNIFCLTGKHCSYWEQQIEQRLVEFSVVFAVFTSQQSHAICQLFLICIYVDITPHSKFPSLFKTKTYEEVVFVKTTRSNMARTISRALLFEINVVL